MKNLVKISKCNFCKSKLSSISSGYDFEYLTSKKKWFFLKCNNCFIFFLSPRPSNKHLKIIYPKNYYSYNYLKINFFVRYVKKILDLLKVKKILKKKTINKKKFSYLDIGCGSGQYLELMNKYFGLRKNNIYGLEKNFIFNKKKFKIFDTNLSNFNKKKKFDFISMFHVIEHMNNHNKIIVKVHSLLKKNGIFVIETPNIDSLDCRLFQNRYWGGYHFPRHWILHSTASLKNLIEKNGFKCNKIFYNSGQSFWMYSIHNFFYDKKLYFVSKFFDPTKIISLPFLIIFTLFDFLKIKFSYKTSSVILVAQKD